MKKELLLLCISIALFAQKNDYQVYKINNELTYLYEKPSFWEIFTKIPSDYVDFGNQAFTHDKILPLSLITASTALLIHYDQDIYDGITASARKWGLSNDEEFRNYLKIGNFNVVRGPTSLKSAMYFIGDGWTHLTLSLSFYAAGSINNDNRALQTAAQIARGMLSLGILVQFLKHTTGRETPIRASKPRGVWRFFPNQGEYNRNVPKYDAFPSGHLATSMMTLTVIAENYPEYKWIEPVGYGLMTLLSFEMVNNGVHWASDYPLALGLGYLFGKIIVNSGRKVKNSSIEANNKISYKLEPFLYQNSSLGIRLGVSF
jgi:hypothetical protein